MHWLAESHVDRSVNAYHLCASGKTTRYSFSSIIIECARQVASVENIKTGRVLPIATKDYPLPAPRSSNSHMDSSSLATRFELTMLGWCHAVELCIG